MSNNININNNNLSSEKNKQKKVQQKPIQPQININIEVDTCSYMKYGGRLEGNTVYYKDGSIATNDYKGGISSYFDAFNQKLLESQQRSNNLLENEVIELDEESAEESVELNSANDNNSLFDEELDNSTLLQDQELDNLVQHNNQINQNLAIEYELKEEDYNDRYLYPRMLIEYYASEEFKQPIDIEHRGYHVFLPMERIVMREIDEEMEKTNLAVAEILQINNFNPSEENIRTDKYQGFLLNLTFFEITNFQKFDERKTFEEFHIKFKNTLTLMVKSFIGKIKSVLEKKTSFTELEFNQIKATMFKIIVKKIDDVMNNQVYFIQRYLTSLVQIYNFYQYNKEINVILTEEAITNYFKIAKLAEYNKWCAQREVIKQPLAIKNEQVQFVKNLKFTQEQIKKILDIKEDAIPILTQSRKRKAYDSFKKNKFNKNDENTINLSKTKKSKKTNVSSTDISKKQRLEDSKFRLDEAKKYIADHIKNKDKDANFANTLDVFTAQGGVGDEVENMYGAFYNVNARHFIKGCRKVSQEDKKTLKQFRCDVTSLFNKRFYFVYEEVKKTFEAGGHYDFFNQLTFTKQRIWDLKEDTFTKMNDMEDSKFWMDYEKI